MEHFFYNYFQTPSQYEAMYDERKGSDYSRFHGYTYDGVWALAKAISIVIEEVNKKKKVKNKCCTAWLSYRPMAGMDSNKIDHSSGAA